MSYLPFKVHWTDGGGHDDSSHKVTHLLENNSDTYCSAKKDNVSIVFEESRGRRFRLSRIDLRTAGDGYTAPCKDAMVFVCDEAPDMKKYKKFDSYTKDQFEDELDDEPLLKKAKFVSFKFAPDDESVDESEDEDQEAILDVKTTLNPLLEGKYVLVKLIRARMGDDVENIDMEFVGFVGQVEDSDEDEDKTNLDVYASRRYMVDTSGPGALSQIGMCFFASLIDSFDDEDLKSSLRNDSGTFFFSVIRYENSNTH